MLKIFEEPDGIAPPPGFDLAPRRKRPLSLWNPLDYLVLLYWVLWFPQALNWYVSTFQQRESTDAFQQRLVLQTLLLLGATLGIMFVGLPWLDVPVDLDRMVGVLVVSLLWGAVVILGELGIGVVATVRGVWGGTLAFTLGLYLGLPSSIALSLALSLTLSAMLVTGVTSLNALALVLSFGMTLGLSGGLAGGLAFGLGGGIAGVLAMSIAFGLSFNIIGGSSRTGYTTRLTVVGVAIGVVIYLVGGTHAGAFAGLGFGMVFALGIPILVVIFSIGLLGWLLVPVSSFKQRIGPLSRTTLLPIPGLREALAQELARDWRAGICAVNHISLYSRQYIPAVRAVHDVLIHSPPDELLSRVAGLPPEWYHWWHLDQNSINLRLAMRFEFSAWLFFLSDSQRTRLEQRHLKAYCPCTTIQYAFYGFYNWHIDDVHGAAIAFRKVCKLPMGQELASMAELLAALSDSATLEASETDGQTSADAVDSDPSTDIGPDASNEDATYAKVFKRIVDLYATTDWLDTVPDDHFRLGTVVVLQQLRAVAADVLIAQNARAPLIRGSALGRATAGLQALLDSGDNVCPTPEWPIVQRVAKVWQTAVIEAGGSAGQEILRKPALNPYRGYSGLPAIGEHFVGRAGVMSTIDRHFHHTDVPPVIVVYGHRRMGKTSILLNFEDRLPEGTLLAYVDMQHAGFVDHTGQFLEVLARTIHERGSKADLDPGPAPVPDEYQNLGDARRALDALLAHLAPQMERLPGSARLLLAIDEFEIIESRIEQGRIDRDVLAYLRSMHRRYDWLALVFAGLHTLAEMGGAYWNAFFSQTENVRVSYLSTSDAMQLITQPHPDFALEYETALVDELYRLTNGQPYLLQRLCWELVEQWNERFAETGEELKRVLTMGDLQTVLEHDFFAAGAYYFDGVWNNVTEHERVLMATLATRESPWSVAELAETCPEVPLEETLNKLRHHDVIPHDVLGRVCYANELMRLFVCSMSRESAGKTSISGHFLQ